MSNKYIKGILYKKDLDNNNNEIDKVPIMPRTLSSEVISTKPDANGNYATLEDILDNFTIRKSENKFLLGFDNINTETLYVDNVKVVGNNRTCYIGYGFDSNSLNQYHYTLDYNTSIYNRMMQFQAAMEDAIESNYSEIIILPGEYYLGSSIMIGRGNKTIRGLSYGTQIIVPIHTPAFILESTGIIIKDLTICTLISQTLHDIMYHKDLDFMMDYWWDKNADNPQPSIFGIVDDNYGKDSTKGFANSSIVVNSSSCNIENINFIDKISELTLDVRFENNVYIDNGENNTEHGVNRTHDYVSYYPYNLNFNVNEYYEVDIYNIISVLDSIGFKLVSDNTHSIIFEKKKYNLGEYYNFYCKYNNIFNKITLNKNSSTGRYHNITFYYGDTIVGGSNFKNTITVYKSYMPVPGMVTWSSFWTRSKYNNNDKINNETTYDTLYGWVTVLNFTLTELEHVGNIFKFRLDVPKTGDINSLKIAIDNEIDVTNIQNAVLVDYVILENVNTTSENGIGNIIVSCYYNDKLVKQNTLTNDMYLSFFVNFIPNEDEGIYFPHITIGDKKIQPTIDIKNKNTIGKQLQEIDKGNGDTINRSKLNGTTTVDICYYDTIIHPKTGKTDTEITMTSSNGGVPDIYNKTNNIYKNYCKYVGHSSIYIFNHWQMYSSTNAAQKEDRNCNKIFNCLFQNTYNLFRVYSNNFYSNHPKKQDDTAVSITLDDFKNCLLGSSNITFHNSTWEYYHPQNIVTNSVCNDGIFRICNMLYNSLTGKLGWDDGVVSYKTENKNTVVIGHVTNVNSDFDVYTEIDPSITYISDGSKYHT